MQAAVALDSVPPSFHRNFQTDTQGHYSLRDLVPGRYRLEVSRDGFASQTITVNLSPGAALSRNVTLAVARSAQSQVIVVASTPLPGLELPMEEIAAPTQTAGSADVEKSGAIDLPDFMNRRLNGVHLNEVQGNPFQVDLNFRGYTASPLLGTPQGISIFRDGVRQNQAFGDVVSWDLIESNAISTITLMPGSDAVFGLNTLGGAVAIQSKDGITDPGGDIQITYGSSGRKAVKAQWGGEFSHGFDWFLAANAFHESGWRYDSPSDIRQVFGHLGWRTARTNLGIAATYAYNTLTGNGVQDYRLLAQNYSSVYTVPDTIGNRSPALTFNFTRVINNSLTLTGNAYYRDIRTETINGNLNPNSLDQSIYQPSAADQAALTAAGYAGFPTSGANASNTPFPSFRCIAQGLEHADPLARCDAVNVFTKTLQNNFGFSSQLTWLHGHGLVHNQVTAGAAFDRSIVDFTQNTQLGYLNPNFSITGINVWEDGSTLDNGSPVDTRVGLHGLNRTWSLYAVDNLSIGNSLHLSFSGRYNQNLVANQDLITPGGGPGSLDAHDVFSRLNPSVGVTWSFLKNLNAYASYTQGSRAPSSIELGCADPLNPCSLPNALASDPALKQVVTSTWEAGLRGKMERFRWSAGAFRADNHDDILFVASTQTGSGYFKNFGRTLREGVQADVNGHLKKIGAGLDYTFLSATYQSVEQVDGSANNTSDTALAGLPGLDGVITIHPGNRIPLIPKNTAKAFVDYQATTKLLLNFGAIATSSSYARGNENNAYQADGKFYLGRGVSPGYAVMNFAAHYDLTKKLQLAVQIDNLLDRHYYSTAQLVATGFTPQSTVLARPFPAYATGDFPLIHAAFFSPGAPRRAWVELKYKF
jgi:outer membrane receptor protein involved in Fe transport